MISGSGVAAVTSLTLFYANYDKDFRQQLITYAPYLSNLFSNGKQKIMATSFEESFLKKKQVNTIETKVIENTLSETKPILTIQEPVRDSLEEKEIKKEISQSFERALNEDNANVYNLCIN